MRVRHTASVQSMHLSLTKVRLIVQRWRISVPHLPSGKNQTFLAKTTNECIFMFQTRMGDTTQGGEGKLKLKLKRYVNLCLTFVRPFCPTKCKARRRRRQVAWKVQVTYHLNIFPFLQRSLIFNQSLKKKVGEVPRRRWLLWEVEQAIRPLLPSLALLFASGFHRLLSIFFKKFLIGATGARSRFAGCHRANHRWDLG